MGGVLRRAAGDRGVRLAVVALLAALLLSLQPLPRADAHTYAYCGHGWSGQHLVSGTIWDVNYNGYTNYITPHIHRNLHYTVHISMWYGAVYTPNHYAYQSCPNH